MPKNKRGRPFFDDSEALRSVAFFDALAMVLQHDPKEDQSNRAAAVSAVQAASTVGEFIGNSADSAVDRLRRKLKDREANALKFASDPQGARSITRAYRLPFMRTALEKRIECDQGADDDTLAAAVAEWANGELNKKSLN